MNTKPIYFYRAGDPYGCLSNFSAHPILLDGETWPTSEHYFQAQKFFDPDYRERIWLTPSPMIAARLGRSRAVPIRLDWEEVKIEIMRKALWAKLQQHSEVRESLLSTGSAELVEHTKNDRF